MTFCIAFSKTSRAGTPAFSSQICHRAVENFLGGDFLAVKHHAVDESLHQLRTVDRIGEDDVVWGLHLCVALLALPSQLLRLRPLGAVLAAALHALGRAGRLLSAANDVIANAGQVLDTAAANEHDRVLLQVVAFARDVRGDFDAVGKSDTGDLPKRGVRLLGGDRSDERCKRRA